MSPSEDSLRRQAEKLERYQEYLTNNYKCGLPRFFSPTGSLAAFQRSVEVTAERVRNVVVAKGVDDAAQKLEKVVAGCDGVFDLTSEPGSGKTSVLPFKFPSKKVVVALPTPFDAWSAFQMATGRCMLKLKGLTLGDGEGVCYTDSYLAANMVLAGYMDYDILIVDECDSGKGVTAFLNDVKVKGKLIIRMSASHERAASASSRAFSVTEVNTLPDARESVAGFIDAARPRFGKRTLVLMPDAQSARQAADCVSGAVLVTASSGLNTLASALIDQTGPRTFVADDVCARGLNLNLDVVVDAQLITEHGVTRGLTDAELYQRKGRVGRNRPGWYVSPGLPTIKLRCSEADLLRSNVMRSIAGIEQDGPLTAHVTVEEAVGLMCSEVEPITIHKFASETGTITRKQSSSSQVSSHRRRRSTNSSKSSADRVSSPAWLSWMVPSSAKEVVAGKSYYVSEVREVGPVQSKSRAAKPDRRGLSESMSALAVAPDAPYAVVRDKRKPVVARQLSIPAAPPVVDLTQLEYHMDWPAAIRDAVLSGGDLPTIVPPHNWRHTSTGGLGCDWYARLEAIAVSEHKFDESEFEVVCRAWNKMVASAWVKKSPGLSSASDEHRIEFCARYFQSYFMLLGV